MCRWLISMHPCQGGGLVIKRWICSLCVMAPPLESLHLRALSPWSFAWNAWPVSIFSSDYAPGQLNNKKKDLQKRWFCLQEQKNYVFLNRNLQAVVWWKNHDASRTRGKWDVWHNFLYLNPVFRCNIFPPPENLKWRKMNNLSQ